MALVKINKFEGSLVAKETMANLNETGLLVYIKSFGYNIDINPVMEATPSGMIEDSPNKHIIALTKTIQISDMESSDNIIIQNNFGNTFKFKHNFKYNTVNNNRVWFDEVSGTRWYQHSHCIEINRLEGEDNSDYAMRITEMLFFIMNTEEAM